ncbi:outer membrane biogenesis protein BamB [Stieleria maiorica]|uniref:Outer membrane biogenesis protein BamB n=1 Tax=Stieleria maiorica TaxID=2795974 RepID=A0A5B9MT46_9BACT|nr:PQQ-binding-like beta-propeller repeat protein [Stieleria maiorica]QEG02218.1 outer membrane biogenesis protein BamB [Stieleria maiorica]
MMLRFAFPAIFAAMTLCSVQTVFGGQADEDLRRMQIDKGIVVVVGLPGGQADYLIDLCRSSDLTIYCQTNDADLADAARRAADAAGYLGSRLFVDLGSPRSIQLGNNIADRVLVYGTDAPSSEEVLRTLRPRGIAFLGDQTITKPVPEGVDDWSHPYHGPDNNPQSDDQLVRGSLRTQFIGYPKFSPMPEQTVVAGGRIYKAMGHIAHKANQNEMLNTLLCINAYNGTILWRRPLSPGFMLHRNTMVATDDALYLGDHEACKIIDGQTGETIDEIKVDSEISDGPVWKWMAMRHGILFALVGNPEAKLETQRAIRRGLGHWPWGMWDGHDYNDPRTSFGFGRTVVAIDLKTKERLWHYRDDEFLDARAVCMNDSQIFCYCPGKFLASIDRYTGKLNWKNTDKDLLDAIGDNQKAQHYITGYATSCYMKCSEDYLFFAGPQRARMVVASAHDGKLAWTHETGNLQLVLRDDGVWAAGPQKSESGMKFDYKTGEVLATFPARRACTRATGCADSIFYRASGGTVRVLTESNTAQHIDPMRPPCQDGVIVAGGHLYWGPWMCGCQLSLYGNIALRPGDDAANEVDDSVEPKLVRGDTNAAVAPLDIDPDDWSTYRGNNARTDVSNVTIPEQVRPGWATQVCRNALPTAPVTADGMVFIADRTGVVQAFDGDGDRVWKAYTAGPIYYPPAVANDRVYVGSADGRVYAFAAGDGRFLWSYRVGPKSDRILVYDHLISAWPVAGGVVVDGDTVYAAAGITHYDGTHVVALDATTGALKVSNTTSGTLQQEVNNGISLQGNLTIVDGELRFLAGGVYETARYDLKTLECLNTPKAQVNSQFRTAFYPYYPDYGKYVSLDYQCGDGCQLSHDASYEGSQFVNLARQPPLAPGTPKPYKEAARWIRRGGQAPEAIWQDKGNRRFNSFAVTDDTLLATGHPDGNEADAFLVSINTSDGSDRWIHPLPALAVKGGTSIDHMGRIYVALENGQLLCFDPVDPAAN